MAITFERDDNNPEAAAAIKPAGRTGWIETTAAGEWTGKFSPTKPSGAGANWREVGYATVTLNDGRQFRAVLDESGKPISVIGDTIGEDPDQTKRWKDRQAAANDAPTERNNNGRRERWNGRANGGQGAWEDVGPAINTGNPAASDKPTVGRVEGTPMPDGTFDNTKPIWVERDPTTNQQVGPAKPLTQQQREQWERDKNGGLTDAEVRERNNPENRVGKPTGNTRTKTENGRTVKETEYLLPDGTKEWRTQEETAPPDRIGKPTGNVRERVEGGKQIKETEYILPDGTKEWRTQEAPSTAGAPEPAGAPKPSFTVGDAAADLQRYQEWLNAEMRKPGATLTAARADQLLEARRKLWDTALSEQAGIVNAQQQAYRDQLAQRGQTLQDQQTRRNSATSIANQAQSSYGDLMDKMGANPGGASIAKAIQEARFNAAAFVDGLSGGGVPEIKMGPAYEQTNQMQLNPRAGSPVPAIPQPGAPTPTANGLGVGAVGNVPAPTGAPAPAPAQPVFRPAPVAPAAPASAPQPAPLSPGQSGMMSPVMDSENPPVPQSPGQAGMMSPVLNSENPPVQDTTPAPAFSPAPQWNPATDPMPESPAAVSMAPQPAPWFLAGSSNGRAYDPTPAISSLVADPNIDNEMLRQAVLMEYPGFNFDALVGGRATG